MDLTIKQWTILIIIEPYRIIEDYIRYLSLLEFYLYLITLLNIYNFDQLSEIKI